MSRTLLVADDALIIRELIKDATTAAGWTVVGEASDGQQAIECYREHRPDVVTLDLVMPNFDGIHALKGILEIDPNARVVIVSALEQSAVLRETFRLGASDFLVKPFDRRLLLATLDKLAPCSV